MSTAPLDIIAHNLKQHGGTFAVSYNPASRRGWTVAIEWGREAPDSPMTGAAAYGFGDDALSAIQAALDEAGWTSCTTAPRRSIDLDEALAGCLEYVDAIHGAHSAAEMQEAAYGLAQRFAALDSWLRNGGQPPTRWELAATPARPDSEGAQRG